MKTKKRKVRYPYARKSLATRFRVADLDLQGTLRNLEVAITNVKALAKEYSEVVEAFESRELSRSKTSSALSGITHDFDHLYHEVSDELKRFLNCLDEMDVIALGVSERSSEH